MGIFRIVAARLQHAYVLLIHTMRNIRFIKVAMRVSQEADHKEILHLGLRVVNILLMVAVSEVFHIEYFCD